MSDTEPVTVATPDKPAKAGKVELVDAAHYPRVVTRQTRKGDDGLTYTTETLQYDTAAEIQGAIMSYETRGLAVFDTAEVPGGCNVEVQTDGTVPA